MKKYALGVLLLGLGQISNAAWIEASGKVTQIMTYYSTDTVLVNLSSSGEPVIACSDTSTFAIPNTASDESRSRMFAMLLAAKTAGTNITIAYDEVGGCEPWGSNSSAYRTIRRMR